MSDGDDGKGSSPPGWYPYGEAQWAWWDGEAFGPFAPRAPTRPPRPHFEPQKPRIGKKATIPLVLLGLILTIGLTVTAVKLGWGEVEEPVAAVRTVSQAEIVDPTDGCARMYEFLTGLQQPDVTEDEAGASLRGLLDAARAHDPQLAIDLQEMLDAWDATRVREITFLIMNRCLSAGELTEDQLAEVGMGPATVS
jgi:hypothetical protein